MATAIRKGSILTANWFAMPTEMGAMTNVVAALFIKAEKNVTMPVNRAMWAMALPV